MNDYSLKIIRMNYFSRSNDYNDERMNTFNDVINSIMLIFFYLFMSRCINDDDDDSEDDGNSTSTSTATSTPTPRIDVKGLTEKAKTIIASVSSVCGAGIISSVMYCLWRFCDCFFRCCGSCRCCCCCVSSGGGQNSGTERTFSL